MRNRVKRACGSALCLTIVLAASTANAGGILPTPGYYSLTVYDPSDNVVYQVEQSAATVNPSTIYELFPETSITVGSTSYLLPNITIFSSGAIEFPNAEPTAIYAAGGNPVTGPWDAIFGLVYDPNTQTWNGNSINYFLGFAAGPPGVGTSLCAGRRRYLLFGSEQPDGPRAGLFQRHAVLGHFAPEPWLYSLLLRSIFCCSRAVFADHDARSGRGYVGPRRIPAPEKVAGEDRLISLFAWQPLYFFGSSEFAVQCVSESGRTPSSS